MMLSNNIATKKATFSFIRSFGTRSNVVPHHSSSAVSTLRHRVKARSALSTAAWRQNSSYAAHTIEEHEQLHGNIQGHAAAAAIRTSTVKSHEEAWMINLGRGKENAWLTGPRSDEWFTGVVPANCPGKWSNHFDPKRW